MSDEHVQRSSDLALPTVAEHVPSSQIKRNPFAGSEPVKQVSAAFDVADEEDQTVAAQLKPVSGAVPGTTAGPTAPSGLAASLDRASRGGGRPLSPDTRRFMEARFGHDFGTVRIHADRIAGDLAHEVRARAFTTGNRIFFAPGEFQPNRTSGKRLLAHELTHVVQQRNSAGRGMHQQLQRVGSGCLNCRPYCSYNSSADLASYNCAGLAHRSYDYKRLATTKALLARGDSVACGTSCDHVGIVKHWLWEFDSRIEDSGGKVLPQEVDGELVDFLARLPYRRGPDRGRSGGDGIGRVLFERWAETRLRPGRRTELQAAGESAGDLQQPGGDARRRRQKQAHLQSELEHHRILLVLPVPKGREVD